MSDPVRDPDPDLIPLVVAWRRASPEVRRRFCSELADEPIPLLPWREVPVLIEALDLGQLAGLGPDLDLPSPLELGLDPLDLGMLPLDLRAEHVTPEAGSPAIVGAVSQRKGGRDGPKYAGA